VAAAWACFCVSKASFSAQGSDFSSVSISVIIQYTGLNFKLDVGLYRLDQQVACQRIDTILDAEKTSSLTAMVNRVLAQRSPAFA
jgi:hypothetical protein